MAIETISITPGDLIEKLQSRTAYRDELSEHIDFFKKSLETAQAVLSADQIGDVQTMCEIMKQAIMQKNTGGVEFARDYIIHITDGGDPKEFFSLKKNKQYKDLDITSLMTPVVQESLELLPLPGLFDLITTGVIEKSLPQIESGVEVNEAHFLETKARKPSSSKGETINNSSIETLFKDDNLWVTYRPNGSRSEERFTTLDNIAVLIAGNNWTKNEIGEIAISLQQTAIKNYKKETGNKFSGVTLGKGYGNRKYYNEGQIKELITFMQDFLPKSRSPYRFTNEPITKWPFNNGSLKKKR